MFLNDLEVNMSERHDGITIEFANDDMAIYKRVFLLLQADDTIIFADTAETLQEYLNSFNTYCKQ